MYWLYRGSGCVVCVGISYCGASWAVSLMTHRTADIARVRWKISDIQDSWATDAVRDLLASIVVTAQIRLTFGFGFRPKVPVSLSVAHTVSAECVTSLSVYFRFRPKVEFPLSVDLYQRHYCNGAYWLCDLTLTYLLTYCYLQHYLTDGKVHDLQSLHTANSDVKPRLR